MPSAGIHGINPDMRFPSHYLLRPSEDETKTRAITHFDDLRSRLSQASREVLALLLAAEDTGMPSTQVAAQLVATGHLTSLKSAHQNLVSLRTFGYLRSEKPPRHGRSAPAERWWLTEAGLSRKSGGRTPF
jgi:hypothetical protein